MFLNMYGNFLRKISTMSVCKNYPKYNWQIVKLSACTEWPQKSK